MTKIVVFSIFFTIISFIILPLGVQTTNNPAKGHADSAPTNPRIKEKLILITLISLVLTGVFSYIIYKFPELENLLKE
jgi:predicted secreted protein